MPAKVQSIRFLSSPPALSSRHATHYSCRATIILPLPASYHAPWWGLMRMARGTANDWCAGEPSGGRGAHMTVRTASTLPRLPWDCCHEASVAPRADLCSATGRLTASRYRETAWPPSLPPPHSAEVWRGARGLVSIGLDREHHDNGMIATRRCVWSKGLPARLHDNCDKAISERRVDAD